MNIPLDKFELWLKNKNLKERTIENYLYYFNKFTFDRLNQESISKFLAEKSNRNSIARSFLVNLKSFLKANYIELGISDAYKVELSDIELPRLSGRAKQRLINPIPHDQIPLIEKALETEESKLKLLLSYYSGLRLGGLLKLTLLSFNWEAWKKNISQMGECRVFEKGDKEGIAMIPAFLMKRLARWIKQQSFNSLNDFLFMNNRSKNLNVKNRGRSWQLKLRQAGIDSGVTKLDSNQKVISGTGVHPHRLRHSFGYHLLKDKGLDIRYIQEALRHSSIQSTQIYTLIDKEDLKEKLKD